MTRRYSGELQPPSFAQTVLNLDVTFHWLQSGDRFWFKLQTCSGDKFVIVDAESGRQTVVSSPPYDEVSGQARRDWVTSPDGRSAVLRQSDNLWLRDLASGDDVRVTHDGEPNFGYGDVDPSYDRQGVARRRINAPRPLFGVLWSPRSRFIVALRQDLRPLADRLFVTEYSPSDGAYAYAHFRRISVAGDTRVPDSHVVAFDTKTSDLRVLALDPQALNDMALHYFMAGVVWWSDDEGQMFLITSNRGGTRYALCSVTLASGEIREILEEVAPCNVRLNPADGARPNVYVMSDGTEFIWYSERSGYGHLYLYDSATGELKMQLTHGAWVVFDLLHVDEARRLIYFTAATRSTQGNPYYRYLYRVSLSGGEPELLTPESADHKFSNRFFRGAYRGMTDGLDSPQPGSSISPTRRHFIDCFSTVEHPPQYVLRRINGEWVTNVLSGDASRLYITGWQPAECVVAKAADGETDLHGILVRPGNFDSSRRYPVIDVVYPGPQGSFAPRTFIDQFATSGAIWFLQTLADAGFVVVAIDGRGTGHRSRAFRDAFRGREDVFGSEDHVTAIQQLGGKRPYMDLQRVGVMGQSFGGYAAVRAMLLHPEFFRVGISLTGPAEYLYAEGQTNVERFFGVPTNSSESRAYYALLDNGRLAGNLAGRLLLIYGELDESVPLKHAFALFDAFFKAEKDFDMMIVPEADHYSVAQAPCVVRRSVQYFIDHLAGTSGCHG